MAKKMEPLENGSEIYKATFSLIADADIWTRESFEESSWIELRKRGERESIINLLRRRSWFRKYVRSSIEVPNLFTYEEGRSLYLRLAEEVESRAQRDAYEKKTKLYNQIIAQKMGVRE